MGAKIGIFMEWKEDVFSPSLIIKKVFF